MLQPIVLTMLRITQRSADNKEFGTSDVIG